MSECVEGQRVREKESEADSPLSTKPNVGWILRPGDHDLSQNQESSLTNGSHPGVPQKGYV